MSQRQLVLVWDRGRRVAKGRNRQDQQTGVSTAQSQEPKGKITAWFESKNVTLSGLLSIVTLVSQVVFLSYLFGSWNTKLNRAIKDLEEITEGVKEINKDIRKLDVRLARIEGPQSQYYREQAVKLGFKDPQIVPAHIAQSQTAQELGGEIPYRLTFTLKEVTKDYVKFFLDGKIGTTEFERNTLSIRYQVRVPFNLADSLRRFGVNTPPLWVAVLDRPTSSTVILAIGPRPAVSS